jgi:tetratricopeptide (TPR) repeat protein
MPAAGTQEARRIERSAQAYLHYSLGRLMEIEGAYSEALVQYRRAASIDSRHCEIGTAVARTLLALGRTDEALEAILGARGECPEDLAALAVQARVHLARDELREAEAILYGPAWEDGAPGALIALLGQTLVSQGRIESAEELYRTKASVDSLAPRIAFLHASALLIAGKLEEAADELKRAKRLDPENRELDGLLGRLLVDIGKPEEGVPILVPIADGAHPTAEELTALARGYSALGEPELALDRVDQAERVHGKTRGTAIARAGVHHDAGNEDAALAAYEAVLEIDPDYLVALNYVAYSLADAGKDLDRAAGFAERAVEIAPDNPFIRDTLGWAYFRLGRLEEAGAELETAVELGGTDAVILEHLGDVYRDLGRIEDAVEAWSRALASEPDRESTRERLESAGAELPEAPAGAGDAGRAGGTTGSGGEQ